MRFACFRLRFQLGDVKQVSLALRESDAIYVTEGQWRFADNVMSLVIRAREDAGALVRATQAIAVLLFHLSHLDPVTYLAVITPLAAVALMASGLPAARGQIGTRIA